MPKAMRLLRRQKSTHTANTVRCRRWELDAWRPFTCTDISIGHSADGCTSVKCILRWWWSGPQLLGVQVHRAGGCLPNTSTPHLGHVGYWGVKLLYTVLHGAYLEFDVSGVSGCSRPRPHQAMHALHSGDGGSLLAPVLACHMHLPALPRLD